MWFGSGAVAPLPYGVRGVRRAVAISTRLSDAHASDLTVLGHARDELAIVITEMRATTVTSRSTAAEAALGPHKGPRLRRRPWTEARSADSTAESAQVSGLAHTRGQPHGVS